MKDFLKIRREDEEAKERIGPTAEQAMKWVLGFAQKDLEPLLPSPTDLVANEVVVFPRVGELGWRFRDYPSGWVGVEERPWKIEHGRMWPKRPNKKSLLTLQSEVRDYLERFLAGRDVSAQLSETIFHVTLMPIPGSDRGVGRFWIVAKKQQQQFILKFLLLLAAYADRIRRCQGRQCTTMFFANHNKQRFCSDGCQNRTGVWRWRKKRKGRRARSGKGK